MGKPTTLLLPITTAFFPMISTPDLINNSMQPFGAHGINNGSLPLMARFPIFIGWKPSTSFSNLSAFKIFTSSKCCSTENFFSHPYNMNFSNSLASNPELFYRYIWAAKNITPQTHTHTHTKVCLVDTNNKAKVNIHPRTYQNKFELNNYLSIAWKLEIPLQSRCWK